MNRNGVLWVNVSRHFPCKLAARGETCARAIQPAAAPGRVMLTQQQEIEPGSGGMPPRDFRGSILARSGSRDAVVGWGNIHVVHLLLRRIDRDKGNLAERYVAPVAIG